MNVQKQRRAEIALRSLSKTEQGQLEKTLEKLKHLSLKDFYSLPEIQKLVSGSGRKLYSLKGSRRLRIVLSINADNNETCTVEDIFDCEDLKQLPFFKAQAI